MHPFPLPVIRQYPLLVRTRTMEKIKKGILIHFSLSLYLRFDLFFQQQSHILPVSGRVFYAIEIKGLDVYLFFMDRPGQFRGERKPAQLVVGADVADRPAER